MDSRSENPNMYVMNTEFFFKSVPWNELSYMIKSMPPEEGFMVTRNIPKGSEIDLYDGSRFVLSRDVKPDIPRKYVRVFDVDGITERHCGVLVSSIKHVELMESG